MAHLQKGSEQQRSAPKLGSGAQLARLVALGQQWCSHVLYIRKENLWDVGLWRATKGVHRLLLAEIVLSGTNSVLEQFRESLIIMQDRS